MMKCITAISITDETLQNTNPFPYLTFGIVVYSKRKDTYNPAQVTVPLHHKSINAIKWNGEQGYLIVA